MFADALKRAPGAAGEEKNHGFRRFLTSQAPRGSAPHRRLTPWSVAHSAAHATSRQRDFSNFVTARLKF
jgi:hypothetical protein